MALARAARVAAFLAALAAGCASVGPTTIARDRIGYDEAVTTSWKRAMLLNMVKLRYGDTPMFLDVASIINSYTLEGQVTAGGVWNGAVGLDSTASAGILGHYADKPTITYNPLLGERFTRSMMTPLQPAVVVSLIQSGWPADTVMRMMVSSANGIDNRFGGASRARAADPEFAKVLQAMRRIQASGAVGMRIDPVEKAGDITVLVLHSRDMPDDLRRDIQVLRSTLGIREDAKEIRVVYGSVPKGDQELALVTRSMLEILVDIASGIEVPPKDVEDRVVLATRRFDGENEADYRPLVRIQSGDARPARPFVEVAYKGHWFWIDENDVASKSVFSFVMMIFSLMDTPAKGQPLITVPVS